MTKKVYNGIIFLEIANDFKASLKEKSVKTLLAMLLIMPIAMSSVVAGEKEAFTLRINDQGLWCGKFYANSYTTLKRYQCKTRVEWEELGVNFPKPKTVVLGPPILGGDVNIRG